MKNLSLTFLCVLLSAATQVFAQCEKDISTHPLNPINSEFLQLANEWDGANGPYSVNSMLNSWSWFPPGNAVNFNLNLTNGWASDLPTTLNLTMNNPFFGAGSPTFIHAQANAYQDRDWKWEDGWELLWMNLGRYPDMTLSTALTPDSYWGENGIVNSPDPDNIPYFVLYNRYRGTMRVFANVWKTNLVPNSQEFMIELKFDDIAEVSNGLSGIMRHAGSYDTALDQPTSFTTHYSPRQAPVNKVNWMVTDFQMGFDPCICLKEVNDDDQLGKLQLMFSAITTTNIEMTSRSIAVDEEITEAGLLDDFLNMSDINTDNYEPGQRIYSKMDDLYSDYQERLEKYRQELDEQRSDFNFLKAFLSKVAPVLTNTFVDSWTYDDVTEKLKEDTDGAGAMGNQTDEEVKAELDKARKKYELNFNNTNQLGIKAVQGLAKGILGVGFDFLNFSLSPPSSSSAPVKPIAPVATFTEAVYKGTITGINEQPGPQLYQPGGVTYGDDLIGYWGYGRADLAFNSYPAYNAVLGLAALLKTPSSTVFFDNEMNQTSYTGPSEYSDGCRAVESTFETKSTFRLRFSEEFIVALNRNLDFDMGRTSSYVQIEVALDNDISIADAIEIDHYENISSLENNGANMGFESFVQYDDYQREIYQSGWVLLEDLNQYIFSLLEEHEFTRWQSYFPVSGLNYCEEFNPINFDLGETKYKLARVKMKIMHDFYFEQIGSDGEEVNTTQIFTYQLFNPSEGINFLGEENDFQNNEILLDAYLPGLIILGSEIITPTHPLVHEVTGNDIFVNGQDIVIGGNFPVLQPGFYPHNLTIQAQQQIHLIEGAHLTPAGIGPDRKTHLRIKKDFYDTPVFEYADNAAVYNFCNSSNAYQANAPSMALRERIEAEQTEAAANESFTPKSNTASLTLYPNPARSELTVRTDGAGIDRLTIFDMSTRPVMQASPGGQSLYRMDISSLAPGVYIVQANSGGEVLTEKLVVAR